MSDTGTLEWPTERLGTLGAFSRGRGGTKADAHPYGLPCIRYGELYTRHDCIVRSFHSFISPESAGSYSRLQNGDVIFAGSGETLEEIGKAAAYCMDEEAYAGADTIIFRPSERLEPDYAGYAVNSTEANRFKSRRGQGSSVMHISAQHLAELRIPVPAPGKQKRIAEILHTVDEAIEHTEALIAKTQQIKAGLMHDLFTRGVTADGKLRPPREEAPGLYRESDLGWIPKAWQVATIGDCTAFIADYRGMTPQYSTEGIPVISAENVGDGQLKSITKYVSEQVYALTTTRGFPEAGDTIFTTEAPVGEIARYPFEGIHRLTRRVFAIRPNERLTKAFLYWEMYLSSKRGSWGPKLQGSTVPRILKPDALSVALVVPPVEEQERVTDRLEAVQSKLATEYESLGKLQELRSGLMSDLLTGAVVVAAGEGSHV